MKLLAPNGKPSNLNEQQWQLVRTPEFKRWFGDWEKLAYAKLKDAAMDEVTLENLSKNVSKVVDENYEPLVVYHFTDKKFNVFEKRGLLDGFFFTPYKKDREFDYGKRKKYFLNIKKMSELKDMPSTHWSVPFYENKWIAKSKLGGGEGIRFIKEVDNKEIYVAFNSNQIKLADGTNTTFDGNNPDIRFKQGGNVSFNYLKNVHNSNPFLYHADFGQNGKITWEIPSIEQRNENGLFNYVIVQSMDSNWNQDETINKIKGEGSRVINDLFEAYPFINSILYDDESEGFWTAIGGDVDELKREDFYEYYNKKFNKGGNTHTFTYEIGGL